MKIGKTKTPKKYGILDGVSRFNVWDRWPECTKVFKDIQNQGKSCAAGWAVSLFDLRIIVAFFKFAVAETLRDRRCIKQDNRDTLSAWDLVSCCDDCKTDPSNG